MATALTTKAIEKSTYVVTVAFKDENDAAIAPATAAWTLSDEDGRTINSRVDVSISSPTSSESIVLSGDDLAILTKRDGGERVLTVEGTYDSTLATGLPFKDYATFTIQPLVAVV